MPGEVSTAEMLDHYFTLRDVLYPDYKPKDLNEMTERYDLAEVRAANAEPDLVLPQNIASRGRAHNIVVRPLNCKSV